MGKVLFIDDRFLLKLKEPAHNVKISKGALLVFDSLEAAQKALAIRNRKLIETYENPEKYFREIVIVELKVMPHKNGLTGVITGSLALIFLAHSLRFPGVELIHQIIIRWIF